VVTRKEWGEKMFRQARSPVTIGQENYGKRIDGMHESFGTVSNLQQPKKPLRDA